MNPNYSSGGVTLWQPTPLLRWKRIWRDFQDPGSYPMRVCEKTLQQLWGEQMSGQQEWRDVPFDE